MRSYIKKIISYVTAFFMAISIMLPSNVVFADTTSKTFDIIEITDFHGTLEDSKNEPVAGVLAKSVKDIKSSNPDRTLIIGGGDLYQGSALSNLLYGKPVMEVMNNIGMAVSTIGNHEFDWGLDKISGDNIAAKYPFVCSNLYYKSTGKRVFEPYKIVTVDGVKIGIVGGVTMQCPSIISKPQFTDKDYMLKDLAAEVNSAAKDAKADGAQIVLAVLHAGDNYDNKTGEIFDAANKLQGVDAVLGGHTHDIVNAVSSNGIPIAVGCAYGKGYIDMKMTLDSNNHPTFKTSYIALNGKDDPNGYACTNPKTDPEVMQIVDNAKQELGPKINSSLGSAAIDLTKAQESTPYGDSLVGNWVSDVIKGAVKSADFGLMNSGGIRCDVPKGNISMSTLYSLMPFDDEIETVDMTAPQIKTILEQAVMDGGKGIQVSGLKYTYDMSKPSMQRVTSVSKSDGTPLDMSDTKTKYTVSACDFMVEGGGDGFKEFTDPEVEATKTHTGILIRDALASYIKSNGTVTASLDGRVKNVESAFGEVPDGAVIIGNTAYDLSYANTTKDVISQALSQSTTKVYVKDYSGNLIDNSTNSQIDDVSVLKLAIQNYINSKGASVSLQN